MISLLETLQEIAVKKYDITINKPLKGEDGEGHHRKNSSIIDIMPNFEAEILFCQSNLSKIKNNNEKIHTLKEKHNKTVAPNKEKEISKNLTKILKENEKYNGIIKDALNKLATDVEMSKKESPDEPETQAKINALRSIQKELMDIISQTQSAQSEFKANIKDKIGRQIDLLDESINKEERSRLCNDPDGFQKLIAKKTLGSVPLELQYAVDDILDKYDDIKKLERSVNYVYQMFADIALLVHNQQENLDNIELNLNKAKDYIEKAEKTLIKAKEKHQKTRKRMCIVLIVGLVLLVIIIVPMSMKLTNQL